PFRWCRGTAGSADRSSERTGAAQGGRPPLRNETGGAKGRRRSHRASEGGGNDTRSCLPTGAGNPAGREFGQSGEVGRAAGTALQTEAVPHYDGDDATPLLNGARSGRSSAVQHRGRSRAGLNVR